MKVSMNWLKDFVDIKVDVNELCESLVNVGFEVAEVVFQKDKLVNIKVGEILAIKKHPDADKLLVCDVNIGDAKTIQIVTAAKNVFEGAFIPVALDNSTLFDGTKIKKGKLRGVDSFGMFCSHVELGVTSDDIDIVEDGVLILKNTKAGDDINKVLGNDDIILDIEITANRPDCNSILGIAREIAAIYNLPLKDIDLSYKTSKINANDKLKIRIDDYDLCSRYSGAMVGDIKINPSPQWMQKRLKSIGLRPINNIVDITNYILIELGQPMHAFDYKNIQGSEIIVKRAKKGEEIKLLDEKTYKLDSTMLTISDKKSPLALAGIMGGEFSGINSETKEIVFESAKFARDNIRRTSKNLNVRSDSSARFEKGVDYYTQEIAIKRALHFIDEFKCGKVYQNIIDIIDKKQTEKSISVDIGYVSRVLGIEIEIETAKNILNALQIPTVVKNRELVCKIPLFREDISAKNDIVEEIIRSYGYDKLVPVLFKNAKQTLGSLTLSQKRIKEIKAFLVNNGYFETLTMSFTTPKMFDYLNIKPKSKLRDTIEIKNALGVDLSIMRTTLSYSMINTMVSNIHKGAKEARFFEISKTYIAKELPLKEQPIENINLILGSFGEDETFYTIKSAILDILNMFSVDFDIKYSSVDYMHQTRSMDIFCGNTKIGYCGQVHPLVNKNFSNIIPLFIAEIDLSLLESFYKRVYKFQEMSKFPLVTRDIAIVVSEQVTAKEILDTINKAGGKILVKSQIFDIYRDSKIGDGKKSVAINLEFRAMDRTLLDDEINVKIKKIISQLELNTKAILR